MKDFNKTKAFQQMAFEKDPSNYYDFACLESLQGNHDKAFELLETALKNGYRNYWWMQDDSDLAPLREQAETWKDLMKKYFPGQAKD